MAEMYWQKALAYFYGRNNPEERTHGDNSVKIAAISPAIDQWAVYFIISSGTTPKSRQIETVDSSDAGVLPSLQISSIVDRQIPMLSSYSARMWLTPIWRSFNRHLNSLCITELNVKRG